MKTRYRHIHFKQTTLAGWWNCIANDGDDILGIVAPGAWRRITFQPDPEYQTEFSADCLTDIVHFIGQLEAERAKKTHTTSNARKD